MEKLLLFLVCVTTMCLLVHSQRHPNKLFTFYCLNMTLRNKGEHITGTEGHPNLYHLVRSKIFREDKSEKAVYSLETVATAKFICMNKEGKLYTVNSSKVQKLKRARRNLRSNKTVALPPKNCLFSDFKFSSRSTFRGARGIYSVRHSNKTTGRFIAFSAYGNIHTVSKHFNTLDESLEENEWIKITKMPAEESFFEYLKKTRFLKSKRMNSRIKACIKKEYNSLIDKNFRNCRQRSCLGEIIVKCENRVIKAIKRKRKNKLKKNEIEVIEDLSTNPKKHFSNFAVSVSVSK